VNAALHSGYGKEPYKSLPLHTSAPASPAYIPIIPSPPAASYSVNMNVASDNQVIHFAKKCLRLVDITGIKHYVERNVTRNFIFGYP
jgi:hypothetical protein